MTVLRNGSIDGIYRHLSRETQKWTEMSTRSSFSSYCFRHGIAHLMIVGEAQTASALLRDFAYGVSRLACNGDSDIEGLRDDAMAVSRKISQIEQEEFLHWVSFYKRNTFVLSQSTFSVHKAFVQLAIGHAEQSPVTKAAETWIQQGNCDWCWFRPTKRPVDVPSDLIGVVQFPKGASGGVVPIGDDKVILFSKRNVNQDTVDELIVRIVATPSLYTKDIPIFEETIEAVFSIENEKVLLYGKGYLRVLQWLDGVLGDRVPIPKVDKLIPLENGVFLGISSSLFFVFDSNDNTLVHCRDGLQITAHAIFQDTLWLLNDGTDVQVWSLSKPSVSPKLFRLKRPCSNLCMGDKGWVVVWDTVGTIYVLKGDLEIDLSFQGTIVGLMVSESERVVIWGERLLDIEIHTRRVRIAPEVHTTQVVLAGQQHWGLHQRMTHRIYKVGIEKGMVIQKELFTVGRCLVSREQGDVVESSLIVRWCLRTLKPLTTYPYHSLVGEGAEVVALHVWNNDKLVVVGRRQVQVRDLRGGKLLGSLRLPNYASVEVLLPDGLIITAMDDVNIHYWNGTSEYAVQLVGHEDDLIYVQRIGRRICSTFDRLSKGVRFWQLQDTGSIPVWKAHRIGGISFLDTDDGRLFSCSNDNQLLEWNLDTFDHRVVIDCLKGKQGGAVGTGFYSKYYSPDILVVWGGGVTASCYHRPHVWDLRSGRLITVLSSRYDIDTWVPDDESWDASKEPVLSSIGGLFPQAWIQLNTPTTDESNSLWHRMDKVKQAWAKKYDLGVTGDAGLNLYNILDDGLVICGADNGDVHFYYLYDGNVRIQPNEVDKYGN